MGATGSELEIGVFRVVVADVVRERGVASGGVEQRGALISISVIGEGNFDEVSTTITTSNKTLIQDFCAEIGLSQDGGEAWGDCSTIQSEVELWCSVLRQHVVGSSVTTRLLPSNP